MHAFGSVRPWCRTIETDRKGAFVVSANFHVTWVGRYRAPRKWPELGRHPLVIALGQRKDVMMVASIGRAASAPLGIAGHPFYSAFLPIPLFCFIGALVTDLA